MWCHESRYEDSWADKSSVMNKSTIRLGSRNGLVIQACSIGVEARQTLSCSEPGVVEAVFGNSLYARFGEGRACIGNVRIGRAPLNIPCSAPMVNLDWRDIAACGDDTFVLNNRLFLGSHIVNLRMAACWKPDPAPVWNATSLAKGLSLLAESLPARLPPEGLADFLRSPLDAFIEPGQRVASAAAPAIQSLLHWIMSNNADEIPAQALQSLLGLGPGLTPSGDDFLAGMTVALRTAGYHEKAQILETEIDCIAPVLTNALSVAHLRASFRHGLNETMHDLLHALMSGNGVIISSAILQLEATRHYSSWDVLAGIATTLRGLVSMPTHNASHEWH